MSNSKKYEPPKPGKDDDMHILKKAGIASIPGIGGSAVILFEKMTKPPLELRRDNWRRMIGEGLEVLEKKFNIFIEELQSNDKFIDAVLYASQIAIRTSQEEKRIALRNAVLNSALPGAPEQSILQMFLNYIDVFTEWHLRTLKLFQNPEAWEYYNIEYIQDIKLRMSPKSRLQNIPLYKVLQGAYPELRDELDFCAQVWYELYLRGLVNLSNINETIPETILLKKRTTDFGDSFLRFIQEP